MLDHDMPRKQAGDAPVIFRGLHIVGIQATRYGGARDALYREQGGDAADCDSFKAFVLRVKQDGADKITSP